MSCSRVPARKRLCAWTGADVAVGSRYLKESQIKIKQSWPRVFLGRVGNALIRWMILPGIHDTQCGFKLFKHDVAREIFSKNTIDGWGFDMEALLIAKLKGYRIIEVPVSWKNAPGSRFRPIRDALRTLGELIVIKSNMIRGQYGKKKS